MGDGVVLLGDDVGGARGTGAVHDRVDDLAADEHRDRGIERLLDREDRGGEGDDDAIHDDHGRANRECRLPRHDLRDDVGAAGVAARPEDEAKPEAGDHAAPEGAQQQVLLAAHHRQEGNERVGEESAGNDAGHGAGDVAAAPGFDHENHEQRVYHDRLQADGQRDAKGLGHGREDHGEACHTAGGEAVGNLEDVDADREDDGAHDDEQGIVQDDLPGNGLHAVSPPPTTHRW